MKNCFTILSIGITFVTLIFSIVVPEVRSKTGIEYSKARQSADNLFASKQFIEAKETYQKALQEKSGDEHCINRIFECDNLIRIQDMRKKAEEYIIINDYSRAYNYYQAIANEKSIEDIDIENMRLCEERLGIFNKYSFVPNKETTLNDDYYQNNINNSKYLNEIVTKPIDNLFSAWENLDLDRYMEQWASNCVQKSKKFKTRYYDDIFINRRNLFENLDKVEVINYKILQTNFKDNYAYTIIEYTMYFHFKSNGNRPVKEKNIREVYNLIFDEQREKWLIIENIDYI